MSTRSAIVVGGGIAGLVCARALALRGIEVTLVERKPMIVDEGGIGIGLRSNAMNALAELGLAEQCLACGVAVEELAIYTPEGALAAASPARRYMDRRWPGFTGMSRAALHAILVEGACTAGVAMVTGEQVVAVHQDAETAYTEKADGSAISADMLVIADGIRSQLRAALFPRSEPAVPTGEGAWRGLIEGVTSDRVEMIYGGAVGTVGYTPMPGAIYLYAVDRSENAPPRDANDLADRFARLISGYGSFVPELLSHLSRRPGDVSYRPLETVSLPAPWHKGRIVVIGDAAHAGPPTLAQGAAMGMEDGVVLAQCVAAHPSLTRAYSEFMDRRYLRVRTIVDASLTISRAHMQPAGRARMREAEAAAEAELEKPY